MGELRSVMNSGNEARALALLDRLDRAFPDGAFAVERRGYRLVAACDTDGDADAHDAAARFVDAHAGASIAGQVRARCLD
jgi:hypothetical protein